MTEKMMKDRMKTETEAADSVAVPQEKITAGTAERKPFRDRRFRLNRAAAAAAAVLLSCTMAACGSASAKEESTALTDVTAASENEAPEALSVSSESTEALTAVSASSEKAPEPAVIGTPSDDPDAFHVDAVNMTGKNITGFAVKENGMDDFGENLLADGDVYADSETRTVWYTAEAADNGASSDSTSSASGGSGLSNAVVTPAYDVRLNFEDGTETVLHSFPFDIGKDIKIELAPEEEGGFAYLEFTSTADGSQINTHDSEKQEYDSENAAAVTEETSDTQDTVGAAAGTQDSTYAAQQSSGTVSGTGASASGQTSTDASQSSAAQSSGTDANAGCFSGDTGTSGTDANAGCFGGDTGASGSGADTGCFGGDNTGSSGSGSVAGGLTY